MATERNQHRIAIVLTRVACGFSTFLLAVFLSTHYNPLGPGDLDCQLLSIVVAKVEIPLGTRIQAEQLTVRQFPRRVLPAGTFAKLDDEILGRVAVVRIRAGEPVTEARVARVGSLGGTLCPVDGYRTMTVKVDDVVGVSDFILPGTLVDIAVTIIQPDSTKQLENVTKIVLLQNIKVLASSHTKPKNEKEVRSVQAVALQVTPEQAEKLALASGAGKLQLIMRSSVE